MISFRHLTLIGALLLWVGGTSDSVHAEPPPVELPRDGDALRIPSSAWTEWLDPGVPDAPQLQSSDFVVDRPGGQVGAYFGYVSHPIWIRFRVSNASNSAQDVNLVVFPESVGRVDLNVFDERTGEALFHGKSVSPARGVESRQPMFPMRLEAGSSAVFVVRVHSVHRVDFELVGQKDFFQLEVRSRIWLALYYGGVIALLFFNALIWLNTREPLYLEYLLFQVSLGLTLAIMDGCVPLGRYQTGIAVLAVVWGSAFFRRFLDIKKHFPRTDRLLTVEAGLALWVAAMNPWPFYPSIAPFFEYLGDFTIVSTVLTLTPVAILLARAGVARARIFLVAWSILAATTLLFLASSYSLLGSMHFGQGALKLGAFAETVLFSFALAQRLKYTRAAEERAVIGELERDRLRSLIQSVCHDLVNPLSVILSWADIKAVEGDRAWLAVQRAAVEQKLLLGKIRELQAIESGKSGLKPVPVAISATLEHLKFFFGHSLREKQLELRSENQLTEVEAYVLADEVALKHSILGNLVSNAIKFSHPGGFIDLAVRRVAGAIEFSVSDAGIGIPAVLLSKLFSAESETHRPGTQGEGGTGFGMPLVKAALDRLGGTIEVESRCREEGNSRSGTVFRVRLPSASRDAG